MPSYACSSLCSSISPYHTIQFSLPKILRLTFPSPNYLLQTNTIFPFPRTQIPTTAFFTPQSPFMKKIHTSFSSLDDRIDKIAKTEVSAKHERTNSRETELELLGKPSPIPVDTSVKEEVSQSPKPEIDEALAPFLKFFKPRDSSREEEREFNADDGLSTSKDGAKEGELDSERRVNVEYYEPKPGDLVVGVVVSGNENKLDVNVGADLLGTMLTKEVLPLHNEEISNLCCDLEKDAEKFMVAGKIGIVKDEEALSRVESVSGRPVVEVGTVLFAEVLGRTLSGRPLLSSRRMFRRVAWHRVRQIKQLNEPIEVTISEWNTGGLLTRIEGLRAFLPKAELMNRAKNFTTLKENIGRQICVLITRIDEARNGLIISERDAWEMLHLREGTLLEGTIRKIFTYGAQVRIGDTNRSGLLHISNMSQSRVTSVSDLLKEGEKVKVLVMKPMFADKISLSIAALESEPGLFLSNKEKVFSEAEEMAKKYRQKLPAVTVTHKLEELPNNVLPFDDEASSYANWEWFKFEQDDKPFGP